MKIQRRDTVQKAFVNRLIDEYDDLTARLNSLRGYLISDQFKTLHSDERKRLMSQEGCMSSYKKILAERLDYNGWEV